ncbi:hypothetical protein L1887_20050 [Cichorium endivia]|nr:hypothetical protein L1887_20050 [Cichorium endivia]
MMNVFSMLKFWRYVGGGDPPAIGDLDSSFNDRESFFDLVFTDPVDENDNDFGASRNVNVFSGFQVDGGDSKSSFRFSSHAEVYSKNKRKILSLDSLNKKTPQSLFDCCC